MDKEGGSTGELVKEIKVLEELIEKGEDLLKGQMDALYELRRRRAFKEGLLARRRNRRTDNSSAGKSTNRIRRIL